MKSERAKEHIINSLLIVPGQKELLITPVEASKAAELAEEDAEIQTRAEDRERAVNAFRLWCPEHEDGMCVDSSHDTVKCVAANCVCCEAFLKYYGA